ncbi:putative GTPase inhibitor [Papiliotrema laurentii]|uniref:GTPase inhibitor n=1 Tax=Papiliotrema laurentii TaxID=5418 RepID=A0AAD9L698_PAPLA|nr:putative GTPase inhibitor [Papiliotrema laurentii]
MVNPNEDTEFNDALRAHGILPPKPPSRSPSPDIPHITHADAVQAIAATATADQLDLLLEGEGIDSDDERMFEEYRRKRMNEMKKEEKRGRYGSMEPLSREDFVKEVTEGSRISPETGLPEVDEEPGEDSDEEERGMTRAQGLKGTGVVVFLYKDSVPLSQHLRPLLNRLAAVHPGTKFLSIPGGMCIPNYPDKNIPTLLIYRNGEIMGNVVAGQGLRGMQTTVKDLEMLLLRYRALEKPSPALNVRREDESEDEEGLERDVGFVNAKSSGIRGGQKVGKGAESDDSDFDM